MGVTGHVTDAEPRLVKLIMTELVNSHFRRYHGSESLCKLLRYLADHANRHPGVALKEYQIATEVFGRPSDFDPQLDSLVRVQAGRLRSKIAEYYSSEGTHDPILVELPKGTYALAFHPATASTKTILQDMQEREEEKSGARPHQTSRPVVILAILLGLAVIGIAALLTGRITANGSAKVDDSAPAAYRVFWHSFVAGPDAPWVIFSNGAFVGRPEIGLRYFNPARDSREIITDNYTGVGEVLAVYNLNQVFTQLHHQIRVKRGSLFSLDDAQNNNLIFVGSPVENLSLLDIPSTHRTVYFSVRLPARPSRQKATLPSVNVHPQCRRTQNAVRQPLRHVPLIENVCKSSGWCRE